MTHNVQKFDFDLAVEQLRQNYPILTEKMYVAPALYSDADPYIDMLQSADYDEYVERSGNYQMDQERFIDLAYADVPQCVPTVKDAEDGAGGGILTRWPAIATAQELNQFIFSTSSITYGVASEHPNIAENEAAELNMWNWYFFDHEAAHMLSAAFLQQSGHDLRSPATACLAENISDTFAVLLHMQRFGKNTRFAEKIQMFRAHNTALNIGEGLDKISSVAVHYTSASVKEAINWAKSHDVDSLSPMQLLETSIKLAESNAPDATVLLQIDRFTRECGESLEAQARYITPAFLKSIQEKGVKSINMHIKSVCRDFLSWSKKYFPDTATSGFDFNAADRALTLKQDIKSIMRKLQAKRTP